METVLARIVADKKTWIEARKKQQPLSSFQHLITPSERSFYQALKKEKTVFIMECKKASPSKGLIRNDFDPINIASVYRHYADAISVLTDEKYFQGDFTYLTQVSEASGLPVLCKDFIVEEYQIYLARYYQANAILLMLSVVDDETYLRLAEVAHSLNMGVLTEVSNEEELERALRLKPRVVGINNRDLRDLSINLERTRQLAPRLPEGTTIISESGIHTYRQVKALSHYANGFLIGSALMGEDNLEQAVRQITLGENKVCGLTRAEDAKAAFQAGAIYGGLIFVQTSPRYIELSRAQTVVDAEPRLRWVGVFRNAVLSDIAAVADQLKLSAVQLHGNESAEDIRLLKELLPSGCEIWRALSVTDSVPQHDIPHVDKYIFDNGAGGTGKTFDWRLLQNEKLDNVLLAGGLTAENAQSASQLGCRGLDFNSGVETAPGKKDSVQLQAAFSALRTY